MSALLIAVIVMLYSFQTLFCKLYTDRYPGRPDLSSPVFCVLESVAITLITWAWRGFRFEASYITVLIGVANALMLLGYNSSLIKASTRGSYAFMNVMMLFGGILLPILYSVVVLDDHLTVLQIAAIFIMLVACVLLNLKEMKLKATSWSYYVFCLLLFLFNGVYGILLKVQSVYNDAQSQEMVIVTFGMMGVFALVQLALKERKNTPKAFKLNGKCILPLIACLISAALAINLVMKLLPYVNLAMFYTVDNGGVLLLSAIYSVVLFKEKPTVSNVLGMILAIVSITMLSI